MPDTEKLLKNAPLMVGVVFVALVTIFGFIGDIPFVLKTDYKNQIEELKKKQEVLETLKNVDNQWYREVSEDVAVMKTDVNHVKEDLKEMKTDIKKILMKNQSR